MRFHHGGKVSGKITGGEGDILELDIEMWASGFLTLTADGRKWKYKLVESFSIDEIENEIYDLEYKIKTLKEVKDSLK